MPAISCNCNLIPCLCDSDWEPGSIEPEMCLSSKSIVKSKTVLLCSECQLVPCICCNFELDDPIEPVALEELTLPPHIQELVRQKKSSKSEENDENVDKFGRVHLSTYLSDCTQDVLIAKEIGTILKTHQLEGVSFMWSHLASGNGCILADYMGLGKTLQVVTTVHSYILDGLARKARRSVLILCPTICIQNWNMEFLKWLSDTSRSFYTIYQLDPNKEGKNVKNRVTVLRKWCKEGGVLLLGYEMYRHLLYSNGRKSTSIDVHTRVSCSTLEVSRGGQLAYQRLQQEISNYLCNPGPDLIVLDEGHRIKDTQSVLAQSLQKIATRRRLVLTGYPLQNSLSEYWSMLHFASPDTLGSYEVFKTYYETPILNGRGTWKDENDEKNENNEAVVQLSKERSSDLIAKVKPVILRRGEAFLRAQLPPRMEYVVFCKLSTIQERLYSAFLSARSQNGDNEETDEVTPKDLLSAYSTLLHVVNHPDIIFNILQKPPVLEETQNKDKDGWEASYTPVAMVDFHKKKTKKTRENDHNDLEKISNPLEPANEDSMEIHCRYEWARGIFDSMSYVTESIENSGKMKVLLEILAESIKCGDKILVFSQSVFTLDCIEKLLDQENGEVSKLQSYGVKRKGNSGALMDAQPLKRCRDPANILHRKTKKKKVVKSADSQEKTSFLLLNNITTTTTTFSKVEQAKPFSYVRIDGRTSNSKRMDCIQTFNQVNGPKIMLISTKAGAEGINLHAANRLVLFDVNWNPCYDHQSMCRSHRFGQKKPVYVYRLVSEGTMERRIYEVQLQKEELAQRIVDDRMKTCAFSSKQINSFFGSIETLQDYTPSQCNDPVLSNVIASIQSWVVGIKLQDTNSDDKDEISKMR